MLIINHLYDGIVFGLIKGKKSIPYETASINIHSLFGICLTGNAQTYTVSSNNQSWSSLVPGGTCTGCTI